MKKIIAKTVLAAMVLAPLSAFFPLLATAAVAPNFNTTGSYVINMNYLGSDYPHDMTLAQDGLGNITGNGGSPAGANVYTWVLTSGTVSGDTIDFLANYTATPDAVTPQTILHVIGTIAVGGSMSGTWTDNYSGAERAGTWASTSGNAVAIPPAPATVKVTIVKYIDGTMATDASAHSMDFPMSATWNAQNIGAGTGSYNLSATTTPAYQATTVDMTTGADYSTNEITGSSVVGASCATANTFMLAGYATGDTLEAAQAAETSMTVPAFVGMTTDKFVIVKNTTCGSTNTGGIGGDVIQDNGVLHVDSVTVTQSSGTANGTFASGWKYVFHITAPTTETHLAMKFADWTSGANTILVANNMHISSAQADNANATILLTGANVYSTPTLNMNSDLNPGLAGRQVDVLVEVSIPTGSVSGAYTTTYGVSTNQ